MKIGSKFQVSRTKSQISSKSQEENPKPERAAGTHPPSGFGSWNLAFEIYLGFGP
jgi:hypothetical protein